MADKTLAFQVEVIGASKEAIELERLTLEVKKLATEKAKLSKLYRDGKISEEQATKQLAMLNTQLVAAKKNQLELRDAVNKSMGVNSRFTGGIVDAGKQLLGFGGYVAAAAAALNKLKNAFMETETGAKVVKQWGEAVKTFFQSVIRGEIQMAGTNALAAMEVAKMMDEMRKGDRVDLVTIARLQKELNELRIKGADVTKSVTEQLKFQNLASAKENELIEYKIKDKTEELKLVQTMLTLRPEDTKLLDMQAQIEAELLDIRGEKSLRIESKKAALRAKQLKEQNDSLENIKEKEKKFAEEQLDRLIHLDDNIREGIEKKKKAKEEEKEKEWDSEVKFGKLMFDQNREMAEREWEALLARNKKEEELVKKKEETILQFKQAGFKGAQLGADAVFDARKSRLNAEMQTELNNENLTSGQRIEIQKKYAREQQKIDTKQALINGALAIGNALATTKPFIPAGIIAGALAGLQTGIQVATIKAQKFATGGRIQGGLQLHGDKSRDNTLIYVKQNETVLTESQVARLGGSGAMRKARVPGYAMGGYVGQQAPEIPGMGFDYGQLARLMNSIEVKLDVNKVNAAQKEISLITEPQRI